MAFQEKNLSVLAYANGFTLWHYYTEDPTSEVFATGYFNPVATLMNKGDVIYTTKHSTTYIHVIETDEKTVKLKKFLQ